MIFYIRHHLFQKEVYHDDCHENQYEQYHDGDNVVDYYIKKPHGDVIIRVFWFAIPIFLVTVVTWMK